MPSRFPYKRFATELAILSVLAGCGELILRAKAPFYGERLFDHQFTAKFPMEINEENFRGPSIPRAKPAGTYRVLALGDSVTFGTGVASDHTWPHRLASRIHTRIGRPVDVINAGIEGASLADVSHSIDTDWAAYDPDLVTLAVTGNMISLEVVERDGRAFSPAERYASFRTDHGFLADLKIQTNRFVHFFCLPSFLSLNSQNALHWLGLLNHNIDPKNPYSAVLPHGYQQGGLDPALAEKAWTRFEERLAKLDAKLKAAGRTLIVAYVPPRFMMSDEARDNEKNMPLERLTIDPLVRFKALAERAGIQTVDTHAALVARRATDEAKSGDEAPMYIPFDFLHLDDAGHDALGEAFAAKTASLIAAP